jgi:hypothetical protein
MVAVVQCVEDSKERIRGAKEIAKRKQVAGIGHLDIFTLQADKVIIGYLLGGISLADNPSQRIDLITSVLVWNLL